MPGSEKVILVVREWVDKAENDLVACAHLISLGEDGPTDSAVFHAQQCIEKYLKALLVWKEKPFPKTHDIGEILPLIPEKLRPAVTPADARALTSYATVTRYPGDYEEISLAEAQKALRMARKVRTAVRKVLPKAALRRRTSVPRD